MLLNKRIEIEKDVTYKKGKFLTQDHAKTLKRELNRFITAKHKWLVEELDRAWTPLGMHGKIPDHCIERINIQIPQKTKSEPYLIH